MNTTTKSLGRERRHKRIRMSVAGTATRPRLSVYKSNRYIHAQIIDDEARRTLIAGSTKGIAKGTAKTDAAKALGASLATQAKAAGITAVVFDRGGFRYTGRVALLAEAARAEGLKF